MYADLTLEDLSLLLEHTSADKDRRLIEQMIDAKRQASEGNPQALNCLRDWERERAAEAQAADERGALPQDLELRRLSREGRVVIRYSEKTLRELDELLQGEPAEDDKLAIQHAIIAKELAAAGHPEKLEQLRRLEDKLAETAARYRNS
jgi:hypothetical protein